MSLPAAQQRILDGIADGLRRSEPKLAAMFGIFTRLCSSETPPLREQLTGGAGWRLRIAALRPRTSRLRQPRPRALRTERGRTWRRLLIASQIAIALVLMTVLVGVGNHGTSGCGSSPRQRAVAQARSWCPAQALPPSLPGK